MNAVLYLPQHQPRQLHVDGLTFPSLKDGFASVPAWVPELLECAPGLVDVLASASDYVAYSVCDYESGPVNKEAMRELAGLVGVAFELDDEDAVLLGPVLVVRL